MKMLSVEIQNQFKKEVDRTTVKRSLKLKHIKLCSIVRLAKAKTMMGDSNLAPWEFAADPRVILVLLSAKIGRHSVVTIFTLPDPTVL